MPWYFVPLRARRGALGVGVRHEAEVVPFDPEEHALLDTLTELSAAALDRAMLARDVVTTRTFVETERAQHAARLDLSRFPHAPGLDPGLGQHAARVGRQARRADAEDLLGHIKDEAESLDEMVRNLLAITRIDAGSLELRRDWVDLGETARRRGERPPPRRRPHH